MKKINYRGKAQANKHVLMAALTYNLKKLMKFDRKKPTIKALEMSKSMEKALGLFKTLKTDLHILVLSLANFTLSQHRKIIKLSIYQI
jgi:hypothetical protein